MGLSLKLAVVSATVVSTAVMFNVLSPFIADFTISDLPALWTAVISWLKPPYLYVVINCIIITIVASSKLQSKLEDSSHLFSTHHVPTPVLLPTEPVKLVLPVDLPPPPVLEPETETPLFHGGLFVTEPVDFVTPDQFNIDEDIKIANEVYEDIPKNSVNKSVISMSTWTPPTLNQVELSFPMEKPPASARFSHRKPAKATAEGGKTLKVAKPKKQDTLENTWKTITEGRSVPLTRHLRKSDTWETHGHGGRNNRSSDEFSVDHHSKSMTKSETFDVNRSGGVKKPPAAPSKLSRSGGSGKLRKDPSLGQEELNRKVEAFIKKFNEDMRLQRQESLNQYMVMINRGAH